MNFPIMARLMSMTKRFGHLPAWWVSVRADAPVQTIAAMVSVSGKIHSVTPPPERGFGSVGPNLSANAHPHDICPSRAP